ncbi:MAG: hypothetical protein KDC38_16750, partial [Planctomycetes bacterium]|nr:hypothetical protein [Planctomycetota bacterium]
DEDSDAGDVDRLFAFPEEFATIERPLTQYLTRMFSDNRYVDPLFLRGVYFTSGIQKGAPIVSACANLLRNASQGTDEQLLEKLYTKSRAFFIRDFYRKKVFKEQGLIQPTRLAMRRKQMVERIGYSVLGVISVLLLAFLVYGGVQVGRNSTSHRDALQALKDAVDRRESILGASKIVGENTRELHAEGLSPWGLGVLFGEQAQEDIARNVTEAEVELFSQGALKPLVQRLVDAFAKTPDTWPKYVAYEKAAHRYLAFHIGFPAEGDEDAVTLESAKLPPEYLDSIEPFLELLRLNDVDLADRAEYEAAFQDLRQTIETTGVRPDYSTAFPLEEADVDRMLGGIQEFWKRAADPSIQDYGKIDLDAFRDWRTWGELVHLSEGMEEKIHSREFELPERSTFEKDRDNLARWAQTVGIETTTVGSLLDSAQRIDAIFAGRSGAPAPDGAPRDPRFQLLHFDDLLKTLRRRVEDAFAPFEEAKIATVDFSLVADARRYREQAFDAFDAAPRKYGPRSSTTSSESLYAAFSISGGRGDVSVILEPAFVETTRILRLIATAIRESGALHDPAPGQRALDSWHTLPAWLEAGREKLAVPIAAEGPERRESLKRVALLSRRAQSIAESVWITRSCEALRKAALDVEGFALMNQFALERAPKFGDGKGFEFDEPSGLESRATFGPAAGAILDFANRLLAYRRSADGPPLLYVDQGEACDDSLGAFVRRYFSEYRKRWQKAVTLTRDAIVQGKGGDDAPPVLDELETPDRLREVLTELRAHIGFVGPRDLDRSLARKSIDAFDEDLGRFRQSYPMPAPSEDPEKPAPDRIVDLTKLLDAQREVYATLQGSWGTKEADYPIFQLFNGASGQPSMWQKLTGPTRFLQESRMDDSVSKALIDRSQKRSTEVEHWIVDAFNQRFEKWSDRSDLKRHQREFPFLLAQSLNGETEDIDRSEFKELWEEAAEFRATWKNLLDVTDTTDAESPARGFAAFADSAVV